MQSGLRIELAEDVAGAYRIAASVPAGPNRGACVLVQSGQMARHDDPTPEAELHDALLATLTDAGLHVVRLDMPARAAPDLPATAEHVALRTARLRRALARAPAPVCALGFSLGARSVVEVLAAPEGAHLDAAVLVGHVIDDPVVVMAAVDTIHLVHGARDYIAYVDDGGQPVSLLAPEQYAERSLHNLIVRPRQRRACTILADHGHLPTPPAATTLAELVVDALSAPTRRTK